MASFPEGSRSSRSDLPKSGTAMQGDNLLFNIYDEAHHLLCPACGFKDYTKMPASMGEKEGS